MARMNADEARALCNVFGIDPAIDWHAMPAAMQDAVLRAADACKYKSPKNANGSRGRYFAAYLARKLSPELFRYLES